jgi:hypothetical protein
MADLGTLTSRASYFTEVYIFLATVTGPRSSEPTRRPTAFWMGGSPTEVINLDNSRTISGDVMEDGGYVERWIRLYHRYTGVQIAAMKSTGGTFSFSGLDHSDSYFCVKLDDAGASPDFNALIYDFKPA